MTTVRRRLTAYLDAHPRGVRLLRHPLKAVRQRRFGTVQNSLWLIQRTKQSLRRPSPYIVLACMPRTGSTFLTATLAEITGYQNRPLTFAYGRHEQELYLPKLLDFYHFGSVTQQHFRATQANLELLREFDIRPVVLVRDIFDVTVSIRDYLVKEQCSNWPTFYCDEEFWELSVERQFDAIIDLGLPWYFSFFVSWADATRKGEVSPLWMTYEEAQRDWSAASRRILDFCGVQTPEHELEAAFARISRRNPQSLRFNHGVTGRGKAALGKPQQDRIARFAEFYPHVDFSMIGIASSDGDHVQARSTRS